MTGRHGSRILEESRPKAHLVGMRLLLVAALLLASAAAAAAAPLRVHVVVHATRDLSWSVDEHDACPDATGSGTEHTTLSIDQVVGFAALEDPMHSPLKMTVTSTRNGTYSASYEPQCGICYAGDGATFFTRYQASQLMGCAPWSAATTDCGTKTLTVPSGSGLYLGWGGDEPTVLSVQLWIEQKLWGDCPGWFRTPRGVTAQGGVHFPNIDPVTAARLLAKGQPIVLHGSGQLLGCSPDCPLNGITTQGTWSLRIERAR
jgi:hypothetical protein